MLKILENNILSVDSKRKKTVNINEIVMLKGASNYTYFYFKNGKSHLSPHTLKYYESYLGTEGFLRVHRGFIINQSCIVGYDIANAQLLLTNGYEVDISRRRRGFLKLMNFDWK